MNWYGVASGNARRNARSVTRCASTNAKVRRLASRVLAASSATRWRSVAALAPRRAISIWKMRSSTALLNPANAVLYSFSLPIDSRSMDTSAVHVMYTVNTAAAAPKMDEVLPAPLTATSIVTESGASATDHSGMRASSSTVAGRGAG